MTRIDQDRDPQMEQLERMKNVFLVAQQRRRDRAAASRRADPGDGDGPPRAGLFTRSSDGRRRLATVTSCRI